MRTLIVGLLLGVFATKPGAGVGGTPAAGGAFYLNVSSQSATCQLNGASPSTCTVAAPSYAPATARCGCWPVGGTAVIAAGGCAGAISGSNFVATSANGLTNFVNVFCDR
jgi:hypothetical protein